jgi:ribosomal-protein-alanine N-acetyltransferase
MPGDDKMNDVAYALAAESDIPSIIKLQEACGLSPWSEKAYREALTEPDKTIYIAKVGKECVGFALTRLITSENLCEILNICVDRRFREKLIGTGLLSAISSHFKPEITRFWLEVREGNQPAIAFYKKHGFNVSGIRKNFYRDPVENALLMQKETDRQRPDL